jgi:hypothetical protein
LAVKPDGIDATFYKSWLLVSKAMLTRNPEEREALTEEADRLRLQGEELQKVQGTLSDRLLQPR